MNDYWNDPPEYSEIPECCDQEMTVRDDGSCVCEKCNRIIPAPIDAELERDLDRQIELHDEPRSCPHGRIENCDACDHLSDFAYDSARERRFFRK